MASVTMRAIQKYSKYKEPTEEDDLRERRRILVENYGGLVKKVARRILRRLPPGADGIEEQDLISTGILGLFEAEARFDKTIGYPFETFAEFRVKGAMLDELRRRDFFPRRLRIKANKVRKAERALEQKLGREPTNDELAVEMELPLTDFLRLRHEVAPYQYVDSDDESLSLRAQSPNPFNLTAYKERREHLIEALGKLPSREQLVLDLYYSQELTLREIAEILSLTTGRISQIKSKAIERLQGMLAP